MAFRVPWREDIGYFREPFMLAMVVLWSLFLISTYPNYFKHTATPVAIVLGPLVLMFVIVTANALTRKISGHGMDFHASFWIGLIVFLPFASMLLFVVLPPVLLGQGEIGGSSLLKIVIVGLPVAAGALLVLYSVPKHRNASAKALVVLLGAVFAGLGIWSLLGGKVLLPASSPEAGVLSGSDNYAGWLAATIAYLALGAYMAYSGLAGRLEYSPAEGRRARRKRR